MTALNLVIAVLMGVGLMTLAMTAVGILRRAFQTGVLKKGSRYFMGGSWNRAKNPILFGVIWGIGVFSALGLFIAGAFFAIGSAAIFWGYWK